MVLDNKKLKKLASVKVEESDITVDTDDLELGYRFKDPKEKRLAKLLLGKYLKEYQIESISDKNNLQEIINYEVIQYRLRKMMDELSNGNVKAIPLDLLDEIRKNSDTILKLKDSLGLRKSRDKESAYDVLEHLKKRFKKWRDLNQASRSIKCPNCQDFILLKMRTECWEAQKHPYFRDTYLYNEHLFKHLGQTVTIDEKFIAACLYTSADYIPWMDKRAKRGTVISEEQPGNKPII